MQLIDSRYLQLLVFMLISRIDTDFLNCVCQHSRVSVVVYKYGFWFQSWGGFELEILLYSQRLERARPLYVFIYV